MSVPFRSWQLLPSSARRIGSNAARSWGDSSLKEPSRKWADLCVFLALCRADDLTVTDANWPNPLATFGAPLENAHITGGCAVIDHRQLRTARAEGDANKIAFPQLI
jgi:hypothetical protein